MLTLVKPKGKKTFRFDHIERAFLAGEVLFNARREAWPPQYMAYFDGAKIWRFDGVRKSSLTLTDIGAGDWVVSTSSAFLPAELEIIPGAVLRQLA